MAIKWRSIGLAGIFLAPVKEGGGMNEEALKLVGKTSKGTAGFTSEGGSEKDFYSNESSMPEESITAEEAIAMLKYGLMDLDPEKVSVITGGEAAQMSTTKKYRAPRQTVQLEHCARVITKFGVVIDFPRLKTKATINWPLDTDNIANVNVEHRTLEPLGVNDAPYEWYDKSELTDGQAGYGL